jgi:hypothetical protein
MIVNGDLGPVGEILGDRGLREENRNRVLCAVCSCLGIDR